jgi:hypothetical protein
VTDSLQNELRKLLEAYPELQNSRIAFSDNGISLLQGEGNKEATLCEMREPGPDVITGPSRKTEVRKSQVHGYGVFAKEPIEAGELIEEVKMLKLSLRKGHTHDQIINDYAWVNSACKCAKCEAEGPTNYMALGYGSIYNHSETPNALTRTDYKTEIRLITAIRRIEQDEEIFVTYGKKYFLLRDFWNNVTRNKMLETFLENKKNATGKP